MAATRSAGSRLGTRFRGKLAAAYGKRGASLNSLWYVYSPRGGRDWVLRSDLEWDHFFIAEFDQEIKQCDYAPQQTSVAIGEDGPTLPVSVVVTYNNGEVGYRHIRYSHEGRKRGYDPDEAARLILAAAAKGIRYESWTELEIRRNPTQLANWRRMVAWLTAAREYSLACYCDEVTAAFRLRQTFTLADIENTWGEAAFPLYAAAVFQLLLRGAYTSDTNKHHLTPNTVVYMDSGSNENVDR